MPQYRRGLAAIEEAATAKGGGNFRPFVPEIKWRDDNEKKYILILTPVDEVATLDIHEWIPVGKGEKANGETYTKYESFLSRKDPFVGEDYDDIEDRLGRAPKTRCAGVAVELEPVMETVRGRQRPKGFAVKTDTFTRKTDDGEEEVTQPSIGLIVQSAALMWSPLGSLDESQGPLSELPVEVTRRGKDQNTRYDFVPFIDAPVDLTPIVDYLDGITYLSEDIEDVIAAIDAASDDLSRAQAVAEALFNRRVAELADGERYEELVAPIEELADKFGSRKGKPAARMARPPRRSQRETTSEASVEEEAAPTTPEPTESKNARFAALKAKVEGK